jgi:hypothetical protein
MPLTVILFKNFSGNLQVSRTERKFKKEKVLRPNETKPTETKENILSKQMGGRWTKSGVMKHLVHEKTLERREK